MKNSFKGMFKNDGLKYVVVLERDGEVAVISRGRVRQKIRLPEFESVSSESPYETIIREYKNQTGYEIINLVLKGIIKKAIDDSEKYDYTLVFKGTECYGSPKSSKAECVRWIQRDRLHRYTAGARAEELANLVDGRCCEFIYGLENEEPSKKEICMIGDITEEDILDTEAVIKQSFATVADTYALTKEEFPNFAGFYIDKEVLSKLLKKPNQHLFGYFDDGRLIGLIGLFNNKRKNEAELSLLSVLPDFRHIKIGESLLDYAVKLAKDMTCETVRAEIMYENTKLRNWLEKQGFVLHSTEKPKNHPYTLAIMKKSL